MSITLKRQLTDQEKAIVLERHGRLCFANGHTIAESESLQYDHIKAYSLEGQSEIDNIAPMCGLHNKEKGQLSLYDFRTKLRLQRFFAHSDKVTLRDFLKFLEEEGDLERFARPITTNFKDSKVEVDTEQGKETHNLYTCPITGWKYFYASLPVELIDSDDDDEATTGLQPRYLMFERVFELFRHFQRHPVLQPSILRIDRNRFKVFDGQHKIASLLLNGRKSFECKVYVECDVRLLNQTNIAAHDKYSQKRFDSSVMVMKLGEQFGSDFDEYKRIEDGQEKSEAKFFNWLRQKDGGTLNNADLNQRFRSFLFDSILTNEQNKLASLVASSNRGTAERPITIDLLSKSIFANFLYRDPAEDFLYSTGYRRETEFGNVIRLGNDLMDLAFGAWDSKASEAHDHQRKLNRMISSKSMMAWSEILAGAVSGIAQVYESDEKAKIFYRDISEEDWKRIRFAVERLVNWNMWISPDNTEIDSVIVDKKSKVKEWFRSKGLNSGYLMGAGE